MRVAKSDRNERQVDAVRRHATALLDAAGQEIENVSGRRIRHVSAGRFAVIETGPLEWDARRKHWTLDVFDRGERIYSAQWHEPNPDAFFSDGMECHCILKLWHWYPQFMNAAAPMREAV